MYVIRTFESPPRYLVKENARHVRWTDDLELATKFKRAGRAKLLLPSPSYGEVVGVEEAAKTFVVPPFWRPEDMVGFGD